MNSMLRRDMGHRIDVMDAQVEKIRRLIENAARVDPELGAGLATSESMEGVQRSIDKGVGEAAGLCRALRTAERVIPDIL